MNRFYLFGVVVLLLLGFPLYAQSTWRCGNDGNPSPLTPTTTARSYFGKEHTPKGHLHMLVVYVQFDENSYGQYVNTYLPPANWGYDAQQDSAHKQEMWQYNDLPTIAQHFPGYPAGQNRMFNADLPIGGAGQVHNLSEYYYQQSNGQFQVTADIFPVPVTLSFSDMVALAQQVQNGAGSFNFYWKCDSIAIEWINQNQNLMPGFNWADYDNRTNTPDFEFDNSTSPPDGKLDYVVFMHRRSVNFDASMFYNGEPQNGVAGSHPNFIISGTNPPMMFYGGGMAYLGGAHTGASGNFVDWELNMEYFQHEFAHNLYNADHHLGANGEKGGYARPVNGWGMMSGTLSQFEVSNAWERWQMGWMDSTDITEITASGIYTLKDICTHNEALKIGIPNSGGQYLWLENHQKLNFWDQKFFYDTPPNGVESSTGVYALITSGANSTLNHNSFGVNEIRVLHKEGHFDSKRTGNTKVVPNAFNGVPQAVWSKLTRKDNPFFGMNPFEGQVLNYNDSVVTYDQIWVEEITQGADSVTYAYTGNENDGFAVGDRLGLSGITPVYAYNPISISNGKFPSVNLNGITIDIVGYDSVTTAYTIQVIFNDYEISEDKRWCGDITLPNLNGDTLGIRKTLTLDQSETPTQLMFDSLTQDFAAVTELKLTSGGIAKIETLSELNVTNNSILRIKQGSVLIIEDSAVLRVNTGGRLIMEGGGRVIVNKGGKILIEPGGFLDYYQDAQLTLADSVSCLHLKGHLTVKQDAVFQFEGDGYVKSGIPPTGLWLTSNVRVEGGNGGFLFKSNDINDVVLAIEDNTYFYPSDTIIAPFKFWVDSAAVRLGENSLLWLPPLFNSNQSGILFRDAHFTSIDPNKKYGGVALMSHRNHLIENTIFQNGQVGLMDIQLFSHPVNNTFRKLALKNTAFVSNTIGLYTYSRNANLENCYFHDNGIGWQADATSLEGLALGVEAHGNTGQAILSQGAGSLEVKNSTLFGNDKGIETTGAFVLDIECSDIYENQTMGIALKENTTLDMSDLPFNTPSQNSIINNGITGGLSKAGKIRISKGYNDLTPVFGGMVFSGTQNLPCNISNILTGAASNQWNSGLSIPSFGGDYELYSSLPNYCAMYFADQSPQSVACGTTPCVGCPSDNRLYDCAGCEKIWTEVLQQDGSFEWEEVALNEAVLQAVENMTLYNDTTGNDSLAVTQFQQILGATLTSVNPEEYWLLDYAFEHWLRAFYTGIENGTFKAEWVNSTFTPNLAALVFLDFVNSKSLTETDSVKLLRYKYANAAANVALGNRAVGKTLYQTIANEWNPTLTAEAEMLVCWLTQEEDFVNGLSSPLEFAEDLQLCSSIGSGSRLGFSARPRPSNNILSVFPNPASGKVTLQWEQQSVGGVEIEVRDLNGRKVYEIPVSQEYNKGRHRLFMTLPPLPSGLYFVRLQSGETVYSAKLWITE